jgi:hypothetical protein
LHFSFLFDLKFFFFGNCFNWAGFSILTQLLKEDDFILIKLYYSIIYWCYWYTVLINMKIVVVIIFIWRKRNPSDSMMLSFAMDERGMYSTVAFQFLILWWVILFFLLIKIDSMHVIGLIDYYSCIDFFIMFC